jgi:hypothetical protein
MSSYNPTSHLFSSPNSGGHSGGMNSLTTNNQTSRRRIKADSDNEMLRELCKVICECLFRSRFVSKNNNGGTNSVGMIPGEKIKKTKWFGIVSDKVPEVEKLMSKFSLVLQM